MTSRDEVLENHTVVVRDGRILDLLPSHQVAGRYAATMHVDRSQHVLLPGLVNAYTQIAPALGRSTRPERLHDGAQLCIADMLKSGTTCFCGTGYFPDESARTALETGMRALIGIPIGETASPWAASGEYLTRALEFRDEYRGHPSIATAFAPVAPAAISDDTFAKIATVADEVEAGLIMPLHVSRAEVEDSIARHGLRPLERMHRLGLLTPALTAVHMAHIDAQDRELAQRGGIALTLCPEADVRHANAPPVTRNADPAELAKFTALAQSWWDPKVRPNRCTISIPCVCSMSSAPCGPGPERFSMSAAAAAFCPKRWRAPARKVLGIDLAQGVLDVAELHALEPRSPWNIGRRRRGPGGRTSRRFRSGHLHGNARARAGSGRRRSRRWRAGEARRRCHRLHAEPQPRAFRGGNHRSGIHRGRALPRGTHEYLKFIRPSELARWGRAAGLELKRSDRHHLQPVDARVSPLAEHRRQLPGALQASAA
jgi:hypothetical protein